jgi:radical SAM protein with 4Fe4S-binding SPASM domain
MRALTKYAEKAKKLPSIIYKAGAQSYIDVQFPRHLFIETTAKCNLTCSYCPREDEDSHMDYELFKTIVDEASRYGPRSFSLHLFGEPLLYPKIIDAIRYIKNRNRHHVVLLTTNGTHLNRFVDSLIGLQVDEIIWSWRSEAKFKPRTIRLLRESTREGTTKFRVRIIKEVTPKEELERWSKWQEVEIRNLHNYGGNVDLSPYDVPAAGKRWACYHLWFAPALAWNGDILLCCADPHKKEVLGNLKNGSFHSIWAGEKLKQIREDHKNGKFEGICKNCDVWKNYPNLFYSWQSST